MKKLIPALVLLLISAMVLVTASYAWFSMNNKVTVTGMEVKTKVSSNMLIAPDVAGATSKVGDELFTTALSQTVKGILEPVSTSNAKNFFYTIDAKANGSKDQPVASSAYIPYVKGEATSSATYGDKFSEVYGVTKSDALAVNESENKALAYVDYVFQLKATNTSDSAQYINITKLEIKYNGTEDNSKAYRVAFFVEDVTTDSSADGLNTVKSTYAVQSSANFDAPTVSSAVVNGESSYVANGYIKTATSLETVPSNTTKYFKVTVRMWLEGQDTTCNNGTFLSLTDKWSLNLDLALESTQNAGVTYITKTTNS